MVVTPNSEQPPYASPSISVRSCCPPGTPSRKITIRMDAPPVKSQSFMSGLSNARECVHWRFWAVPATAAGVVVEEVLLWLLDGVGDLVQDIHSREEHWYVFIESVVLVVDACVGVSGDPSGCVQSKQLHSLGGCSTELCFVWPNLVAGPRGGRETWDRDGQRPLDAAGGDFYAPSADCRGELTQLHERSIRRCSNATRDMPELEQPENKAIKSFFQTQCRTGTRRLRDIANHLDDALGDWTRFVQANCRGEDCGRIETAIKERALELEAQAKADCGNRLCTLWAEIDESAT